MQTLHIIPSGAATQAAHNFNNYHGQGAGGYQSNAYEQPAPQGLIASILWQVNNAPVSWEFARGVRDELKNEPTLLHAVQLAQEVTRAAYEGELELKGRRQQQIAAIIHHSPEFWNNTWYGRDRAQSYLSTIMDEDTELSQLNTAALRIEAEDDLWRHVCHLVEEALVNADQIESAMRKAVRNPKTTEADDAAAMKVLAEKLLASQGVTADKWVLKRTAQRVYEMLWDAENPQELLQVLVQAMGESATTCY